jgi:hypothetical protein
MMVVKMASQMPAAKIVEVFKDVETARALKTPDRPNKVPRSPSIGEMRAMILRIERSLCVLEK